MTKPAYDPATSVTDCNRFDDLNSTPPTTMTHQKPETFARREQRRGLSWLPLALALTLTAALVACGSTSPRDIGPDQSLEISEPLRAGNSLIYLDRTREQILSVSAERSGGPALAQRRADTGQRPVDIEIGPDDQRAFVLNAGSESLSVYDLEGDDLSRQNVQLDSGYQSLTVGPAGDFALLTFDTDNPDTCDVACNLAEIGVVDLRNGVPDEAEFVRINNQASELIFAPDFALDGADQRLVAALTPSQIAFIDLTALTNGDERNEKRYAPLTTSQAERVRQPTKAVFHISNPEDAGPNVDLFVLTEEGSDITQIAVRPTVNPDSDTKYDISINQLAAGDSPRDVTVLEGDTSTRLLTIDRQQAEFTLIDVNSGDSNTYELPMATPPSGLLQYTTVTGVDDPNAEEQSRRRVLVYSSRSRLVAIIRPETIALRDDNPILGQSVEALRLPATPNDVRMDASTEQERAIALHSGGGTGITVLDLRPNNLSAIPIQGSALADVQFVGNGAWSLFRGNANIGRFDLSNGHPTTWELPASGEHILFDDENQLALVDHQRFFGSFTVLDTAELTAGGDAVDNATYNEGIFVRDYFQQPR